MVLELVRRYYPEGTNGELSHGGAHLCSTIELPWKDNQAGVSCIPEGKYQVVKSFSPKHKWHLAILNVPDRLAILIHPANYASKELRGCIAPVSNLTHPGIGTGSRKAFEYLIEYVYEALKNEIVYIQINSKQ